MWGLWKSFQIHGNQKHSLRQSAPWGKRGSLPGVWKAVCRSGALHVHMHLSMSCALCLAWWCFHCQSQLERPAAQLLAEEHSVNTDDPFGNVVCGLAIGFEKMSWFEYWKHVFLKVIRVGCKLLYQHCMLLRYVGIVFWMQKIQRNSSNGQFHCFHYVR